MPLVIVHTDQDSFELRNLLMEKLPGIVARFMSTGEGTQGHLVPEDIIVSFKEGGVYDVNVPTLGIYILIHAYPERIANLEDRNAKIVSTLQAFLGEHIPELSRRTGFVWTLPLDTAFVNFMIP